MVKNSHFHEISRKLVEKVVKNSHFPQNQRLSSVLFTPSLNRGSFRCFWSILQKLGGVREVLKTEKMGKSGKSIKTVIFVIFGILSKKPYPILEAFGILASEKPLKRVSKSGGFWRFCQKPLGLDRGLDHSDQHCPVHHREWAKCRIFTKKCEISRKRSKKWPENGPKWPENGPEWPEIDQKRVQNGQKLTKNGSKMVQSGHTVGHSEATVGIQWW